MPQDPRSHLDLQLLLVLADGERHGYALVQAVEERTNGLVVLDPGNLYRLIRRLLGEGLIAESERRAAEDLAGERRRYYRLTALGERVLAAELRRLHALVSSPAVRTLLRQGLPPAATGGAT
jgi:DNA-binding PadR family transcriptional regulator